MAKATRLPQQPAAQDNDKIVQFLSTTVSWYRQRTAEEKLANEPADVTFEQENSTIADQVVQQAFEYGRNEAQLQSKRQPAANQQSANTRPISETRPVTAKSRTANPGYARPRLQSNREKLARSAAAKRRMIQAQIEELQGELGLLNARHDALQTMAEFVSSSGSGNRLGLRAQVEELARSVPPALSGSPNANASPGKTATRQYSGAQATAFGYLGAFYRLDSSFRQTADAVRHALFD